MISLINSYGLVPQNLMLFISECVSSGVVKDYENPISGVSLLYLAETGLLGTFSPDLKTYLLSKVDKFDSYLLKGLFDTDKDSYYEYLHLVLTKFRSSIGKNIFNEFHSASEVLKLMVSELNDSHFKLFAVLVAESELDFYTLISNHCDSWLRLNTGLYYGSISINTYKLFYLLVNGYCYITDLFEDVLQAKSTYATKFYSFLKSLYDNYCDDLFYTIPEDLLSNWFLNVSENETFLRDYIKFLRSLPLPEDRIVYLLSKIVHKIPLNNIPADILSKIPSISFI